jgi:hypothetical protein
MTGRPADAIIDRDIEEEDHHHHHHHHYHHVRSSLAASSSSSSLPPFEAVCSTLQHAMDLGEPIFDVVHHDGKRQQQL